MGPSPKSEGNEGEPPDARSYAEVASANLNEKLIDSPDSEDTSLSAKRAHVDMIKAIHAAQTITNSGLTVAPTVINACKEVASNNAAAALLACSDEVNITSILSTEESIIVGEDNSDVNVLMGNRKTQHPLPATYREISTFIVLKEISKDVTVKNVTDVGSNSSMYNARGMKNFRTLEPLLDAKDGARQNKKHNFAITTNPGYRYSHVYRDRLKNINHKADALVLFHSAYDITLEEFAIGMTKSSAHIAYVTLMYHPAMFSCLKKGRLFNNSVHWEKFGDTNELTIQFNFRDGGTVYHHDFRTYSRWFTQSLAIDAVNNKAYHIEVHRHAGDEITLLVRAADAKRGKLMRSLSVNDTDKKKTLCTYWRNVPTKRNNKWFKKGDNMFRMAKTAFVINSNDLGLIMRHALTCKEKAFTLTQIIGFANSVLAREPHTVSFVARKHLADESHEYITLVGEFVYCYVYSLRDDAFSTIKQYIDIENEKREERKLPQWQAFTKNIMWFLHSLFKTDDKDVVHSLCAKESYSNSAITIMHNFLTCDHNRPQSHTMDKIYAQDVAKFGKDEEDLFDLEKGFLRMKDKILNRVEYDDPGAFEKLKSVFSHLVDVMRNKKKNSENAIPGERFVEKRKKYARELLVKMPSGECALHMLRDIGVINCDDSSFSKAYPGHENIIENPTMSNVSRLVCHRGYDFRIVLKDQADKFEKKFDEGLVRTHEDPLRHYPRLQSGPWCDHVDYYEVNSNRDTVTYSPDLILSFFSTMYRRAHTEASKFDKEKIFRIARSCFGDNVDVRITSFVNTYRCGGNSVLTSEFSTLTEETEKLDDHGALAIVFRHLNNHKLKLLDEVIDEFACARCYFLKKESCCVFLLTNKGEKPRMKNTSIRVLHSAISTVALELFDQIWANLKSEDIAITFKTGERLSKPDRKLFMSSLNQQTSVLLNMRENTVRKISNFLYGWKTDELANAGILASISDKLSAFLPTIKYAQMIDAPLDDDSQQVFNTFIMTEEKKYGDISRVLEYAEEHPYSELGIFHRTFPLEQFYSLSLDFKILHEEKADIYRRFKSKLKSREEKLAYDAQCGNGVKLQSLLDDNSIQLKDKRTLLLCEAPGAFYHHAQKEGAKAFAVSRPNSLKFHAFVENEMYAYVKDLKLQETFDVVIADGGVEVNDFLHEHEDYVELIEDEIVTACEHLDQGGTLIIKVMALVGSRYCKIYQFLRDVFDTVTINKPTGSSETSFENYLVCTRFDAKAYSVLRISKNCIDDHHFDSKIVELLGVINRKNARNIASVLARANSVEDGPSAPPSYMSNDPYKPSAPAPSETDLQDEHEDPKQIVAQILEDMIDRVVGRKDQKPLNRPAPDGYYSVDVMGDGACLYRALALSLTHVGIEIEHDRLKTDILDYIENIDENDELRDVVRLNLLHNTDQFKDFSSAMDYHRSHADAWGNTAMIIACSQLLHVRVRVYMYDRDENLLDDQGFGEFGKTIYLGNIVDHFYSIFPDTSTEQPLTIAPSESSEEIESLNEDSEESSIEALDDKRVTFLPIPNDIEATMAGALRANNVRLRPELLSEFSKYYFEIYGFNSEEKLTKQLADSSITNCEITTHFDSSGKRVISSVGEGKFRTHLESFCVVHNDPHVNDYTLDNMFDHNLFKNATKTPIKKAGVSTSDYKYVVQSDPEISLRTNRWYTSAVDYLQGVNIRSRMAVYSEQAAYNIVTTMQVDGKINLSNRAVNSKMQNTATVFHQKDKSRISAGLSSALEGTVLTKKGLQQWNDPLLHYPAALTDSMRVFIGPQIVENNQQLLADPESRALLDTQRVLVINGVPGSGKTRLMIDNFDADNDIIATMTREQRNMVLGKLRKKLNLSSDDNSLERIVRTTGSFLVNNHNLNPRVMYVDEAMQAHPGELAILALKYRPMLMVLIGDSLQLNYIERDNVVKENFPAPTLCGGQSPLFRIDGNLSVSHRVPRKISNHVASYYKRIESDMIPSKDVAVAADNRYIYSSDVLKTALQRADQFLALGSVMVLAFTNETAANFNRYKNRMRSKVRDATTIHVSQGEEADRVIILRDSAVKNPVYEQQEQIIVAMTRHKKGLYYFTKDTNDKLSKNMALAQKVDSHIPHNESRNNGKKVLQRHLHELSGKPILGGATSIVKNLFKKRLKKFKQKKILGTPFQNEVYARAAAQSSHGICGELYPDMCSFTNESLYNPFKTEVDHFVQRPSFVHAKPQMLPSFIPRSETYSHVPADFNEAVYPILSSIGLDPKLRTTVEYEERLEMYYGVERLFEPLIPFGVPDVSVLSEFHDHYIGTPVNSKSEFDQEIEDLNKAPINAPGFVVWEKSEFKERKWDNVKPHLQTAMYDTCLGTTSELLNGFNKRNGDVMRHIVDKKPVFTATVLFDAVFRNIDPKKFMEFGCKDIGINASSLMDWKKSLKEAVFSSIQAIPIETMRPEQYEYTPKPNAKPKMTPGASDERPAPQMIAAHSKELNALFSPPMKELLAKFTDCLNKNILFYTGVSDEEFEEMMNDRLPPHEKIAHDYKAEFDMTQFDKSQHFEVLLMNEMIMEAFGFPHEFIGIWHYAHVHTRLFNRKLGFRAYVDYQRKSGDASTYTMNTITTLALIAATVDLTKCPLALFSGDDSLLFTSEDYSHVVDDFAWSYGMECKFLRNRFAYFCSKFILPTHVGWKLVPDVLKLVVKLGRKDLRNWNHVREYMVSIGSNFNHLFTYEIAHMLSDAFFERYLSSYDFVFLMSTLKAFLRNYNNFKTLYYVDDGAQLCYDPSLTLADI